MSGKHYKYELCKRTNAAMQWLDSRSVGLMLHFRWTKTSQLTNDAWHKSKSKYERRRSSQNVAGSVVLHANWSSWYAVLCITCRRLDKLCQRLNLHELPLKVLWFRISTDIVRYRGNITICFNESATLSGRCSARWKCLFFFLFFLLFITLAFFGHFFYAFLLLQRILAPFRLFLSTTQQNIRSDDMAWQEQLQ